MAFQPPVFSDADLLTDGDLPPEVAHLFLAASSMRKLLKGQELFDAGSDPQSMYGVLRGKLKVGVTAENGTQFCATHFGPNSWIGEVPLIDRKSRMYHAVAIQDSEIAVLSSVDFWRVINAHPEALLAVTRMICTKYRWALAWIEDASLRPLPARLAARISALCEQLPQGSPLDVHMSQHELADHLGVSRQSINQQLKEWEREGILCLSYGRLQILDLPRLITEGKIGNGVHLARK